MSTLLPTTVTILSRSLVMDPPMTDAEFEEFCRLNELGCIERTREGVILMNPPAGMYTGDSNSEIITQLRNWWRTHRRGRVFDSNSGFYLSDGSMLSPDGAYLSPERLRQVTKEDGEGFPHICPDFVIELFSKSDRLKDAKAKMERWIENGVQLGWLIHPYRQRVWVYKKGLHAMLPLAEVIDGEGPVAGFRLDLTEVWSCYEAE